MQESPQALLILQTLQQAVVDTSSCLSRLPLRQSQGGTNSAHMVTCLAGHRTISNFVSMALISAVFCPLSL